LHAATASAGGEDEQVLRGPEIEGEEFAEMLPLETKSETESEGSAYVDLLPLEYEQYEQKRAIRMPSALANQGGEGAQGPVPSLGGSNGSLLPAPETGAVQTLTP
jgi:hypothetical protein